TSTAGPRAGGFSGDPGPLRLLNGTLGDQIGWLLPLALIGGASALGAAWRARRRRELAALVVVGGWFVSGVAVFSFSGGTIHSYYLSALAPPTCALAGIAIVALWRDAIAGGRRRAVPVLALALTAGTQ